MSVVHDTDTSLPAPNVTVRIPQWLAKQDGFASRELQGEVKRMTAKAVQLRAVCVVRSSDHCLRCGAAIDNPVSRLAGYGPYCSDYLGIPRDFTEADIAAIREAVKVRSVCTVWLPLSKLEVLDGELVAPEPSPAEKAADEPVVTLRLGHVKGEADDRLLVFSPFRLKDAIKSLAGRRWSKDEKCWHLPATATAARGVARIAVDAQCTLRVEGDAVQALLEVADQREAAQAVKTVADEDVPLLPVKDGDDPHWAHQRRAFHLMQGGDAGGLFMEQSTGKSRVVVDIVCHRQHHRTLIIGPNKAVGVWPREFRRHGVCDVTVCAPRRSPRGGKLSVTKRAEAIRDALATTDGPLVVVVNYESAWREPMAELLLSQQWDCTVLDESHRIKAPGGKQSLFCSRLRTRSAQRLLLTGTPTPHDPLDVYAQYRFADPGIFGTSYTAMRNRYAVMGGFQNREVLAYRVAPTTPKGLPNPYFDQRLADEYNAKLYSIGYRVQADDVFDREKPLHVPLTFVLEAKAQRIYEDLHNDLYAAVDEGEVTAANGLVRLLRLSQVTSGRLPVEHDDGDRTVESIDDGRRALLADFLEDVPQREPVVVFCRFTPDLDSIREVAEKQGRRYMELSGRRDDGLTEDATMHPDCDVLGVQIQAGGTGVDLQRSHIGVFYNVNWNLGDYDQAMFRQDRPGQTHRVTFTHLIAERTVDEQVYQALDNRRAIVDYVLEHRNHGDAELAAFTAGAPDEPPAPPPFVTDEDRDDWDDQYAQWAEDAADRAEAEWQAHQQRNR